MGQVEKWPFSMALIKVDVNGLKHALWRNSMVSAIVPAGMTLLTCSVMLSVLVLFPSSLTRHRPVRGSRYPSRIVWALSLTVTCAFVKFTSHPLSQRRATEIRVFLNSWKMWPMRAF